MSKSAENIDRLKDLPESVASAFRALYQQMQSLEHKEACKKLFAADANELNATYRPPADECL